MEKIDWTERIYMLGEGLSMKLVPQRDVGPIFKWLFKVPILAYRLGLGWMVARYILLLTSTGRKTGRPRQTALEYFFDRGSGRYRIVAGWAGNTDWYRNVRSDPRVRVQVGGRGFAAVAEQASDEEVAHYMQALSERHPRLAGMWNRWSDRPVDGTFESYLYAARFFPSIWLRPIERADPH